jgi:hypothetical protein
MAVNRGTGAGGANTNASGLSFEEKTGNQHRLKEQGYSMVAMQGGGKFSYYMEKDGVVFMMKGGLKTYMKEKYGVEMFREPDEAYLIRDAESGVTQLKILEKKNQNMEGSVDTKLLAGPGFLEEYKWSLNRAAIHVEYAFCVSSFLKEKILSDKPKWQALRDINKKYGIAVLFGDDEDYFEKLDEWLLT